METEVNDIMPPKKSQETKCRGNAKYTKIFKYFEDLSIDNEKYNELFTGGKNGIRCYIQTEKFNEIFYNDSFNFLDILYLFISCASSQKIGILNFLLSYETEYGAKEKIYTYTINFDNLNKDLKEYEEYTIRKRRLFTLAVLSLIQDYFNTYEVDKKTKEIQKNQNLSKNEIILEFMFKSIFNNKERLLNIFKKTKTVTTCAGNTKKRLNLYEYLENIFEKTKKIHDQINGVKQQILNYFNFYYNSKEQNESLVKDFLNTCGTEIVGQQIESEQKKIEQYNNFWINCEDGFCYSLNNYIETALNGNKEQFFYILGAILVNYQNGIETPFCNNDSEPLTPDYIFNELYKIEDYNITYFNKFNEGINDYYKQQLIELQTQYDTLIQIFNQQNQIHQVQNSNENTQMQNEQISQYIQSEVINEAQYNITQNNQNTNTFQQNQQTLQNLDGAMEMFGNGFGKGFGKGFD